jgi:F-box and WD-40 domain protein 1/11
VHRGSVLCLKFEGDWDQDWTGERLGEDDRQGITNEASEERVGAMRRKPSGTVKRGFMVTGSSDCSVCVWDLYSGRVISGGNTAPVEAAPSASASPRSGVAEDGNWHKPGGSILEREVIGEVRAILKGHKGGVLDLRIDKRWIVSWYDPSFMFKDLPLTHASVRQSARRTR